MIEVSVSYELPESEEDPPPPEWVESVVQVALEVGGVTEAGEVSVLVTGDERIRDLNREYRTKDSATDVLSFAQEEGEACQLPPGYPRLLGDLVVSVETIRRQAANHSVTYAREMAWAIAHGALHLLGFDHQDDHEEAVMRGLEQEALSKLSRGGFDWSSKTG